MRLLIILILLIYFSAGCSDGVKIKMNVKNKLQFSIESIVLKTTGGSELFYKDLLPNELVELRLKMTDIPKTDGHYIIQYCIKDSTVVHHFGYYTNGYPLNIGYNIGIHDDTILIREF